MILLDCTLRDGGYYNNWDFPPALIVDYLAAVGAAGINYAELGYRSLDTTILRGNCANITDHFIRSLPIPQSLKIAVMVNDEELTEYNAGPLEAAKLLFVPASQSPVKMVRLACRFSKMEAIVPACIWLKEMGYQCCLNIRQSSDLSQQELEHCAHMANQCAPDVLYFADGLGSLNPLHTARIIQTIRQHWQGELGIHAHDNMELALANTLCAVDEGVTWCDSTVHGMGRGAGNTKTESLLIALGRKTNMVPLLAAMRQHFQPLQIQHGWGTNPYYFLAGTYGIHPTYIQMILTSPQYHAEKILSAIEYLRDIGSKKYSVKTMEKIKQLLD